MGKGTTMYFSKTELVLTTIPSSSRIKFRHFEAGSVWCSTSVAGSSALHDSDAAPADAFPVAYVGDFLLFAGLHEAGLGVLPKRYEFEPVAGIVANDWVERAVFVLRRLEPAHG